MTRRRSLLSLACVLAALTTATACHSSTAPSGGGASISGSLTSGSAAAARAGSGPSVPAAAYTGMQVSVVGTSLSTTVDASNAFSLSGLGSGTVQLRFQGNGVDSTVNVLDVQSGDAVSLVLVVTGSTVAISSDSRTNSTAVDEDGIITALGANQTFTLNGKTIETAPSTIIQQGSTTKTYVDLAVGMQVHVTGQVDGDAVAATQVTIENSGSDQPVTLTGSVGSLSGTSSSFQFFVGSTLVQGDNSTIFASGSFASLKNGTNVTVIGTNRSTFVQATSIQIS